MATTAAGLLRIPSDMHKVYWSESNESTGETSRAEMAGFVLLHVGGLLARPRDVGERVRSD